MAGDLYLANADCAEDFDIAAAVEPGTLMVLDEDGRLQESTRPYDTRVVGVVSGAGRYRPAIILDKQAPASAARLPVALMGKVYCKVDPSTRRWRSGIC